MAGASMSAPPKGQQTAIVPGTVQDLTLRLAERRNEIERLGTFDGGRVIAVARNAMRKLLAARYEGDPPIDMASLVECVIRSAQMGLEAGTDQVYLVPFKDKRTRMTTISMIVGPRGMIDLVMRSGNALFCDAHVVMEGDEFYYNQATHEISHVKSRHRPVNKADRDAAITHVYATLDVVTLVGGKVPYRAQANTVLTRADIEFRRSFSRASSSGPWVDFFEGMCATRALKILLSRAPQAVRSKELEDAMHEDASGNWAPRETIESADSPALGPSRTQSVADSLRQKVEQGDAQPAATEDPFPPQHCDDGQPTGAAAKPDAPAAPPEATQAAPKATAAPKGARKRGPVEPPPGASDNWTPDDEGGAS
jgi:phage RecT family recombinase